MSHQVDETAIRQAFENLTDAIRNRDLDAVVANHADDIVMFDVPPPQNGGRGRQEYAATWPPFFDFIADGAVVEIAELDVMAGTDVAYAFDLLRCGTPEDLREFPDKRLRLNLGTRAIPPTGARMARRSPASFVPA